MLVYLTLPEESDETFAFIDEMHTITEKYYDDKKARAAIIFIENFCRHHEGELAPQHIKLELWQKALISAIFGIVDTRSLI